MIVIYPYALGPTRLLEARAINGGKL